MYKFKVGDYVLINSRTTWKSRKGIKVVAKIVALQGEYHCITEHHISIGSIQERCRLEELLLITREDNPELFI